MWSVVQPKWEVRGRGYPPRPRASWGAGAIIAVAWTSGCASKGPSGPAPIPVIYATPTVVTPREELPPRAKFDEARAEFEAGHYARAADLFDQVVSAEPAGELTPAALFNAGLAWEQAGQRDRAVERFRTAIARFASTEQGKSSAIAASRLMVYLEQWSSLSGVADVLLARSDLSDVERLAAYGAKALAVVEVGDPEAAERYIGKGQTIVEALRLGEGGKLPVEAAQIEFALGEVRKQRSERITFAPLPPNFAQVLETRCQGLLDAQSAYSEAMRSYDAHWAAMSGYRVGELYQRLHDDVMNIPLPKAANTEEKKLLFRGAMHLRYRVLLSKGLKMMEHTIMLGDRTGESSAWIDRARDAKRQIEQALAEQKESLAKLPYTERQLEQAFKDLAQQHGP
jgi:tetratricopeptide (TPR) repeat protein